MKVVSPLGHLLRKPVRDEKYHGIAAFFKQAPVNDDPNNADNHKNNKQRHVYQVIGVTGHREFLHQKVQRNEEYCYGQYERKQPHAFYFKDG